MRHFANFLFVLFALQTGSMLAQSCVMSSVMTVQIAPSITLSGYKFNTGCLANSGEIDLKVLPSGTFTYQWSNNKTTQDIKNLVAGTYTVTVTSAAGCTKTASFVIASTSIAPEPQYLRGTGLCNPTGITVRWEGPTTGTFELRYRLSTATTFINIGNVGNVEAYNVTGLLSNKTYLFQVRHLCTNGTTKSTYKGVNKKTSVCFDGDDDNPTQNLVQSQPTGSLTTTPNPASDFIELAYTDEFSGKIEVVVTDLSGRIVYTQGPQNFDGLTAWKLPVSQWPNGIYQAIVRSAGGNTHASFVVSAW